MKNWWVNALTMTDRTNIVCFAITMVVSFICITVAYRMKFEGIWKFQIGWILFLDIIGVVLLVTRLTGV